VTSLWSICDSIAPRCSDVASSRRYTENSAAELHRASSCSTFQVRSSSAPSTIIARAIATIANVLDPRLRHRLAHPWRIA
jgi:hypothetical protein